MKKAWTFLTTLGVSIAIVATAFWVSTSLSAQVNGQTVVASTDLLNGAFEGEYVPWEGADARQVAPSWSLWYVDQWPGEDSLAPPHASATVDPDHARSGKAQGIHTDGTQNFAACFYQQIDGLVPGHVVHFSAWAKVDEADDLLRTPDRMQTRLGIDLNGGTDPRDIDYHAHPSLWSLYTDYGEWQNLSVELHADSPRATLYLCAHPIWPGGFHVYWDDASLSVTPGAIMHLPIIQTAPCRPELGTLGNPDMEKSFCGMEAYQTYLHFENIFVAPGWTPFWNTDFNPDTAENRQPEFGPTDRSYRVYSGQLSQQVGVSGGGTFEAGVYQIVWGLYPGDIVRFRMQGMGWNQYWPSVNPVDEFHSDYQEKDGLRFRIGIDPYGGKSYTSPNIVWSEMVDPYDDWHQFEIVTTARNDWVSVWLYAHPSQWQMRYNESFWDGGEFEVLTKPGIRFSPAAYNVQESAGAATVTVTLDRSPSLPVTVHYATGDQSAQAPDDYTACSGTLTFAPGTTVKTFDIPIAEDTLDEGNETLLVTLSTPQNGVIQGTNPAVVTIEDDDAPAPACDEGNGYCEDNDTPQTAYGPLALGTAYSAYPEDAADYYYFVLTGNTLLTVRLTDYTPTGISGTLSLYGPAAGGGLGDLIEASDAVTGTTLSLGPQVIGLEAGRYTVLVETDVGAVTDGVRYTLSVQE